jgi:NAD+ kinase
MQFSDKKWVNFGDFYELVRDMDIIMAVGGDGTILRCAGYMTGCRAELLGINTGTLGFMASLETNQLKSLKNLKDRKYTVTERMMLDIKVIDKNGSEIYSASALNDVSISRTYSKIFDFDIFADEFKIGSYRADGVIFSTPTGSTAYALSAGGPVIEPDLECIEMNLICPHSLFIRPMLFSDSRVVRVECDSRNMKDVYISVDGNEPFFLSENQYVLVKKSDYRIKLIDMNENTFFSSLNKKLINSIKN